MYRYINLFDTKKKKDVVIISKGKNFLKKESNIT